MTQESRLVITIDSRNAERNARNLGNELDSIEKKGDFASKSMDSVSVATRALAGHMAGLVTIGTAVSKMKFTEESKNTYIQNLKNEGHSDDSDIVRHVNRQFSMHVNDFKGSE